MEKATSKDGTTIAFDRLGDGPPVIMVCGAMADRALMRPTAEELAKHFTVFNYDRRGRGDSGDTTPYAVEREIEDIEALIAEAGGTASVYGHSSGAGLVLRAAAHGLPIARIALHDPPYAPDEDEEAQRVSREYGDNLKAILSEDRRGEAVELFMTLVGMPQEMVEGMRNTPRWSELETIAPTLAYDSEVMDDIDRGGTIPVDRASRVTVPALVLTGGADYPWMSDVGRRLANVLPGGQHRALEGQEHVVPPEVLVPVLAEFFGEPRILLDGLAIGESPRWHEGRLWFCNWGTQEIVAVDHDGNSEVMARVPAAFTFSIDWLPDGRLLVVLGQEAQLLRQEVDGTLGTHADLGDLAEGFNEIAVDARGNAYVNGGSFDFVSGAGAESGVIVLVTPDGTIRQVADDINFGNGMTITPDGSTLIVAESWAQRLSAFDIAKDGGLSNRRVWAGTDGPPDGICLDAEDAVWYADVPNKRCVRVCEGGEVLQQIELDRGAFACILGGPDGRTLFMLAAEWGSFEDVGKTARTGQVLIAEAPATHAGRP